MRALCLLLAVAALVVSCGQKPKSEPVTRPDRSELRAYHGAPPVIPHDLADTGRKNCLSCHGPGQNNQGKVIAAMTPHPTWSNCEQCHVARTTDLLFAASSFLPLEEPKPLAMPSPFLPPYIPHRLDNGREQVCETCHIGPGARTDLVPKHGPRSNCRQCHLPSPDNPTPG